MSAAHIVTMPKGFLVLRILQIVFALIVAGLTAFLLSNTIGFVFTAIAFGIFCAIITLIIVAYDLVAEKAVQKAYNMWAVLALDVLMVLFWLSAMGAMAALRAAFTIDITFSKRELVKRYYYTWAGNTYLAILSAAAGVAAIELILFIVSLVMFSIRLHRHRTSKSSSSLESAVTAATLAPEKIELQQTPAQGGYYTQAPHPQTYPNYQQAPMQPQPQAPGTFSPVSPVHTGQPPYQPTMSPPPHRDYSPSPPPQFAQPAPHYPVTTPPQGYHEVAGQHGLH